MPPGRRIVAYCGYMAAFGPTEGNEEDDYLSVFPRRFVFGEGFHRPRLHFLSATAAHPSDRYSLGLPFGWPSGRLTCAAVSN